LDASALLDSGGNALTVTNHTFSNSKGVVTLSGDLAELGYQAFIGQATLTQIQLPQSLEKIGVRVFSDCTTLSEVIGMDNVNKIDTSAFENCDSLVTFTVPSSVTLLGTDNIFRMGYSLANCDSLKKVSINGNLDYICGETFYNDTALEAVELPDTVKYIYNGAFYNCKKLKTIKLPDSLVSMKADEDSTPDYSTLSNTVGIFRGCTNLQQVEFNQNLVSIEKIGAFEETGLTSIKLPDSLTLLGKGIFYKCGQLDTALLGKNLTDIKDQCFEGCGILKEIYSFAPTAPALGTDVFLNCQTDGILHIPGGADYSTWQPELPVGWQIVDDL
jgi:hypothetical protein